MNDDWITGMADGTFDVDGSSDSFRALLTSSVGTLQFVMRNGTFPHIDLPESPAPFPVHRFSGDLRLKKGEWELSSGKLESRDGIYQVSGTASASQNCDFLLTRGDDRSWELTGTLTAPSVAPANGGRCQTRRSDCRQTAGLAVFQRLTSRYFKARQPAAYRQFLILGWPISVPRRIQRPRASHSQTEKCPGTKGTNFISIIAKPTNAPNRAIKRSAMRGFIHK